MNTEVKLKAPGLAVTSLVCGILGFFTCLFTGIPAIITGHLAQSKIKQSNGTLGGQQMALIGTILGYVTTSISIVIIPLAALTTPAVFKAIEKAELATNIANSKEIHSALTLHALDHEGSFPENISELMTSGHIIDLSALDYKEDDSTLPWTYVSDLTMDDTDNILLAGPATTSKPTKRILVFVDGTARAFPEEEAQNKALEQGVNLP